MHGYQQHRLLYGMCQARVSQMRHCSISSSPSSSLPFPSVEGTSCYLLASSLGGLLALYLSSSCSSLPMGFRLATQPHGGKRSSITRSSTSPNLSLERSRA